MVGHRSRPSTFEANDCGRERSGAPAAVDDLGIDPREFLLGTHSSGTSGVGQDDKVHSLIKPWLVFEPNVLPDILPGDIPATLGFPAECRASALLLAAILQEQGRGYQGALVPGEVRDEAVARGEVNGPEEVECADDSSDDPPEPEHVVFSFFQEYCLCRVISAYRYNMKKQAKCQKRIIVGRFLSSYTIQMRLLKPNVLKDVQSASRDSFRTAESRINLSYQPVRRFRVTRLIKVLGCLTAAGFLIFGFASAPTNNQTLAANSPSDQERQALEAQLKDLESQINTYQNQITGYQKQGSSLKGEISQLNNKVASINLQIKAITLTLSQLDQSIGDTQHQIISTEQSIETNKGTLAGVLQELYKNERTSLLEVFLKNPKLSDFFSDVNNLTLLQDNLRVSIIQIQDLHVRLQDQKSQLALARADATAVKDYQNAKKSEAESVKNEKNTLLVETKGQESKFQVLLKQTKETAAQIRTRIFQLLGGGELSFEQAYDYAKLAGSATGVRPALILSVLDRESALGKNVGRCSYKTAMSPANQQVFLSLLQELNISPDSVSVSCPNADGVYGGAMGPAQFVPSTWNIYKDQISKITGHTPANPWNNADAFAATALYLKDAGAGGNPSLSQERIAAAKYYAGGRWRSYLWTYGQAVVSRAQQFQDDIDTITG